MRANRSSSTAITVLVASMIVVSAALAACGSDPPVVPSEPASTEPDEPDASAAPSQPDPQTDAGTSDEDSTAGGGRPDNTTTTLGSSTDSTTTTPADDGFVSGTSDSERSNQAEQETTPAEAQESEQSTEAPSTLDDDAPRDQASESTETGDETDETTDLRSDSATPDTSGSEVAHLAYQLFGSGTQTLGQYHGRPLVVNFFSSSCAPCIVEMPDFQRVYESLGDEVAFLGLSVDPDPDDSLWLIERTGVTYDLGSDSHSDVFMALDGLAMPTSVFISREGGVVERFSGRLTESDLLARIEDIRS